MAVTYFGNNDNGDGYGDATYTRWLQAGYSCPGSGTQNVITLDLNIAAIDTGTLRCAIYDSDHNFVTQWDAAKTPGGTGWLAVTDFVDQGGSPHSPQLTGGATYYLVTTGSSGVTQEIRWDGVASGIAQRTGASYVDGFPASIADDFDTTREYCIRAGVEPAAPGGIVVLRLRRM